MKLANLKPGERCRITKLSQDNLARCRRLMEMGFLPGTMIMLAYRSFFALPVAVRIRGSEVILGAADVAMLEVELV